MKIMVRLLLIISIPSIVLADEQAQVLQNDIIQEVRCQVCHKPLETYDYLTLGWKTKICDRCAQGMLRPTTPRPSPISLPGSAAPSPTLAIGYGTSFDGEDDEMFRPISPARQLDPYNEFRPQLDFNKIAQKEFEAANKVKQAQAKQDTFTMLKKKQRKPLMTEQQLDQKTKGLDNPQEPFWGEKKPEYEWSYEVFNNPGDSCSITIQASIPGNREKSMHAPRALFGFNESIERYFHDTDGHLVVKFKSGNYRYMDIAHNVERFFQSLEDLQGFLKDKKLQNNLSEFVLNPVSNDFVCRIIKNEKNESKLFIGPKQLSEKYTLTFNAPIEQYMIDEKGHCVLFLGSQDKKYCYVNASSDQEGILFKDRNELEAFLQKKKILRGSVMTSLCSVDIDSIPHDSERKYAIDGLANGLKISDGSGNGTLYKFSTMIRKAWIKANDDTQLVVRTHDGWFLCDTKDIRNLRMQKLDSKVASDMLASFKNQQDTFVPYALAKEPNELQKAYFSQPVWHEYVSYPALDMDFLWLRLHTIAADKSFPFECVYTKSKKQVAVVVDGQEKILPDSFVEVWQREGQIFGKCEDGSYALHDLVRDRIERYQLPKELTYAESDSLVEYGFKKVKPENELEKIAQDSAQKFAQTCETIDKKREEAAAALAALNQARS